MDQHLAANGVEDPNINISAKVEIQLFIGTVRGIMSNCRDNNFIKPSNGLGTIRT